MVTLEARGFFLVFGSCIEEKTYVIKKDNEQHLTVEHMEEIVKKSRRSIERYIEEWVLAGLVLKEGRGKKIKFVVNPKLLNKRGKLSSKAKVILERIEKEKTFRRKIKKRSKEKNNVNLIRPTRVHLKKGKPESYSRQKMEQVLPSFEESVLENWRQILYQFNNSCALTGINLYRKNRIKGMEHFIPISIGHGGTNELNVYPTTKKSVEIVIVCSL